MLDLVRRLEVSGKRIVRQAESFGEETNKFVAQLRETRIVVVGCCFESGDVFVIGELEKIMNRTNQAPQTEM